MEEIFAGRQLDKRLQPNYYKKLPMKPEVSWAGGRWLTASAGPRFRGLRSDPE